MLSTKIIYAKKLLCCLYFGIRIVPMMTLNAAYVVSVFLQPQLEQDTIQKARESPAELQMWTCPWLTAPDSSIPTHAACKPALMTLRPGQAGKLNHPVSNICKCQITHHKTQHFCYGLKSAHCIKPNGQARIFLLERTLVCLQCGTSGD